ncbi:MAG: methylmalonyl Co-A mutase-associated GTPase MeaB [Bacteroidota bacterium]
MEKPDPSSAPTPPDPRAKAAAAFKRHRRRQRPLEYYLRGIENGDRVVLGQAITLIESTRPDHQRLARSLVEACLPRAGRSTRLGITGTPGVGKSTFIEALGQYLLEQDHRLAILAIDPSSQRSGGSILGDKTRMEVLTSHEAAFIRPSPAGNSLGGVARQTRETILLCEAAGYDTLIVETVGVGQSETAVHSMVDFFLLLLLPGAGDELQGIKRGIVEMADLIAVNKADGNRLSLAKNTQLAYRNALHLFPPSAKDWSPRVLGCSALERQGMAEIWTQVLDYRQQMQASGYWEEHRRQQSAYWFRESIDRLLREIFYQHPAIAKRLEDLESRVLAGQVSSFGAAQQLLDLFQSREH